MSIEMKNPVTIMQKVDAASNLVEQMQMAHMIHDEAHFQDCHKKIGALLFDALRMMEEKGIE